MAKERREMRERERAMRIDEGMVGTGNLLQRCLGMGGKMVVIWYVF